MEKEDAAPYCSLVVVAAGRASRMEGVDKILCPMGNEPLLLHTLRPFQQSDLVDEIVIVTREDLMVSIGTLCSQRGITKVRRLVKGGDSRPESVQAGLRETDPRADVIAIHDGARPFVTAEVLEAAIEAARQRGCRAGDPGERHHQARQRRRGCRDPGPGGTFCRPDPPGL